MSGSGMARSTRWRGDSSTKARASIDAQPVASLPSAGVNRIAPIFPVRDITAALAHYERLGFDVRAYEGGQYGYARHDGVELHLGEMVGVDTWTSTSSAYLWVDDADALAAQWQAAGVDVHLPVDTEWGQYEGAHVDPDGNIIRFGSPGRS